jgi:hypothetical protein
MIRFWCRKHYHLARPLANSEVKEGATGCSPKTVHGDPGKLMDCHRI